MKINDIIQDAIFDNQKVVLKFIYAGYVAAALWIWGPFIVSGLRSYLWG